MCLRAVIMLHYVPAGLGGRLGAWPRSWSAGWRIWVLEAPGACRKAAWCSWPSSSRAWQGGSEGHGSGSSHSLAALQVSAAQRPRSPRPLARYLPPSPSLCHPLTSPGASDQVPAVAWGIQGQPPAVGCRTAPHTFSSPPSPGSSFQVSLGALNGEVLVLNKDSGAGHGAVLPSHMAVTHPHRQQGPGCLPCTHSLGGPA